MDWLSFEDSYTGIADPEIDAFLSEVGPVIGIPISRGDLLEVGPDTAELIQAAYSFLAEGVRAFVGAAQAAAVRTHGSKTQLESALSANQNDLTRYIKAINGFADALDSRRKIADFLPSLQLSHYEDFLAAVLRGGYTALPASELFLFQKLLSLARVRYPGMDYRTELARWVAEGADENELQAFAQAPNQTLRLAEILRGGVDWFWSRVQLRQTVG